MQSYRHVLFDVDFHPLTILDIFDVGDLALHPLANSFGYLGEVEPLHIRRETGPDLQPHIYQTQRDINIDLVLARLEVGDPHAEPAGRSGTL